MRVEGLFPVPVGMEFFDRNLTKNEMLCLKELEMCENQGNKVSKNSYILNLPQLKNVKKQLDNCLNMYFKNIVCPPDGVEVYITQSWLNTTNSNEHHHMHKHSNSYISGVFYVHAEGESDKITFKAHDDMFSLEVENKEHNVFNSLTWWLPVHTGDILLFPSKLEHFVTTPTSKNTRVSIAFNTFLRGNLGAENRKTQLFLKGKNEPT